MLVLLQTSQTHVRCSCNSSLAFVQNLQFHAAFADSTSMLQLSSQAMQEMLQ